MKIGMAITCLAICLVSMADLAAQSQQRSFPYQALVKKDGAEVLSGPASVHYATETLKQGATVEVYRHDPGGWCAIRPTPGSFSLVPESALTKSEGNLGRVNEEGIKAWVGTRLGAVDSPLWQIKLRKDEVLEILGEVSWPHPDGHSTIWYQVSPPSGEFRWINIADILPPKKGSDLPEKTDHPPRANAIGASFIDKSSDIHSASYESDDPTFEDRGVRLDPPSSNDSTVNRGWRQARQPIRIADSRSDISTSVEPFKIPAIEGPSKVDPLTTSTPKVIPQMKDLDLGKEPGNLNVAPIVGTVSKRIGMLESSLTIELLKSPSEWELESILRSATDISTNSNQVTERQHADRLISKIRKCVAIQSKFDVAYNGKLDDVVGSGLAVGSGIDSNVQFGNTYDAHGWLNKLVRSKGSLQPTYVLEDDNGRILYHVAPAPGLNLNRYLRSKVGVIGRRGFHQELRLDHVTAERIVVIDSLRR